MNTHFLPYREYRYTSPLPAQAILDRISADLEPERLVWFFEKRKKPFEGNMRSNEFEMRRILWYRNSFVPWIFGKVADKGDCREVHIRMRMHRLVEVLVIVWLGVGTVALTGMAVWQLFQPVPSFWPLAPLALLAIGYLVVMGGFLYEVQKVRSYFSEWLEASL